MHGLSFKNSDTLTSGERAKKKSAEIVGPYFGWCSSIEIAMENGK